MIDYTYGDLFLQDSIDKQLNIVYDGGNITNEDIYSESMTIDESLCSEESLNFGCCESSQFKIRIANHFTSLYGRTITVTETLDGNTDEPFQLGVYKVQSDVPTADRIYRDITAYDAMYDILNADAETVANWYNAILPDDDSTVTMKAFRISFLNLFGIESEDVTLVNDDMTIEKTISTDTLSGKDVINAICEINGCFGHIGRDGKFQWIYLTVLSEDTAHTITSSQYQSCDYQDFTTATIDKLQIRQEENDIGCSYGDGENCYVIEDNFLVYGKGTDDLSVIAANTYSAIAGITYRPINSIIAIGNPCVMVGDGIFLSTKYQDILTYVLQRTISGIQALTDAYSADGTETCENTGNGLESQITQLKGKSNVLERTIEEMKSTISDVEKGLQTQITQTAESFSVTISQTVTSTTTEYYKSTSPTELSGGEWTSETVEWEEGYYIWTRTTTSYASGSSVTGNPVCITGNTGATGEDGEDAVYIIIDSSNGTVFKNSAIATILTVTVISGNTVMSSSTELAEFFGDSAYLSWKYTVGSSLEAIELASNDSRLSDNGFMLTLTASDVSAKAVFTCTLNVD